MLNDVIDYDYAMSSSNTTAHDILTLLRQVYEGFDVPRVRALHLPPSPWNGSKDGEFGALELEDGSLGLTYVLLGDTLAELTSRVRLNELVNTDALQVAEWWIAASGARRTLGFAAVNALTRHVYDRIGYVPPDAADSIGALSPQAGEQLGMVGFFAPLIQQATANGAELTVVELRGDLVGEYDGYRITQDVRELEHCTKVLSTSTVLLNDTVDEVLAHCRSAQIMAMIGPSASCLPDPLFSRGVNLLGGVWIDDAAKFTDALRMGDRWGRYARKTAITPQDYPGTLTLLEGQARGR